MSFDDQYEEVAECPICMDELDITDRSFKPCKCGYQMCRFCWNTINENLNGKCPACRQPYNEENFQFIPPNPQELVKQKKKEKEKEKKQPEPSGPAKRSLNNVRVIQRNLVYVTNISLNIAKEEILRRNDYFGRFGKINKIVVNKTNVYNGPQGPSVSAYVTYFKGTDSGAAIKAMDGAMIDGRLMRCSFGTTKYCSYFLRGIRCPNPECMYLHELGEEVDSFTKEDMAQGKHLLDSEEDDHRHRMNLRQSAPNVPTASTASVPEPHKGPGFNPLAHSQPIAKAAPVAQKLPQPAAPAKPQSTAPVWKSTEPVVPNKDSDVLSATLPTKKEPRPPKNTQPPSKSPPPAQVDQSILPASAQWGTRSATFNAFDDDFEEYSQSSSESDPKLAAGQKSSNSGSGSAQPVSTSVKQVPANNPIPASEPKEDPKSKNNNTNKKNNNQKNKQQQEWRAVQTKPAPTSSPEVSNAKEEAQKEKELKEQKEKEAREKELKEQKEREAKEREQKEQRERERLEKEAREKEAKEKELKEQKEKEAREKELKEKLEKEKKEREAKEQQERELKEKLAQEAAAAAATVSKVDLLASAPTVSSAPSNPNNFFSADPAKDNGGFDDWLKVRFTDLLMGDMMAPMAPIANPVVWSNPSVPLPIAPISSNAPARSRFGFAQDDDANTLEANNSTNAEPSEEAQSTLRALFPNVNISFAQPKGGVVNNAVSTPGMNFNNGMRPGVPNGNPAVARGPMSGFAAGPSQQPATTNWSPMYNSMGWGAQTTPQQAQQAQAQQWGMGYNAFNTGMGNNSMFGGYANNADMWRGYQQMASGNSAMPGNNSMANPMANNQMGNNSMTSNQMGSNSMPGNNGMVNGSMNNGMSNTMAPGMSSNMAPGMNPNMAANGQRNPQNPQMAPQQNPNMARPQTAPTQGMPQQGMPQQQMPGQQWNQMGMQQQGMFSQWGGNNAYRPVAPPPGL